MHVNQHAFSFFDIFWSSYDVHDFLVRKYIFNYYIFLCMVSGPNTISNMMRVSYVDKYNFKHSVLLHPFPKYYSWFHQILVSSFIVDPRVFRFLLVLHGINISLIILYHYRLFRSSKTGFHIQKVCHVFNILLLEKIDFIRDTTKG